MQVSDAFGHSVKTCFIGFWTVVLSVYPVLSDGEVFRVVSCWALSVVFGVWFAGLFC